MLLAVDIGNTNITIGLFRAGSLISTWRAKSDARSTGDELALTLDGLLRLDGSNLAAVDSIACASVVPALSDALAEVAQRSGLPLIQAAAGRVPIAVRVDQPAEVGADRLINTLAAARLYGTPAVVADLGTATTFDAIAADGAYVGGAIAPGIELGLDALATRTAKLPRVDLRHPDRAIGRNTIDAIRSGTVLGYQALVTGMLARLRSELADAAGVDPSAVHTILTGGLSGASWARSIAAVDEIDPDLTLKGLAIFHAEVSGGEPLEVGLG